VNRSATPEPPVVDATAHLVEARLAEVEPGGEAGASTWHSDWPPDAALPVESYRREMAAAGVDRAVLVTTMRAYGCDNRYAADLAVADPVTFAGVGNLDVLAPGAVDTLTRWVTERGMCAVRFYGGTSIDAVDWLGNPMAASAWRCAGRLGVAVSAQRTRISTLPALAAMLERFPEVPLVVYSLADPPVADGPPFRAAEPLLAMARYPRVYLNLSVRNLDAVAGGGSAAVFFEVLADRFGAGRIMWGSYSMFRGARAGGAGAPSLGEIVERVRGAFSFLSAVELAQVMGGTAWSLYRREPDVGPAG
jgi:predicted TIM-barrel fold metal-dependent hydrolase